MALCFPLDITHWLPTDQSLGLLAPKPYEPLLGVFSWPSAYQGMDCGLSKGLPHSPGFTSKGVWHLCWSHRNC